MSENKKSIILRFSSLGCALLVVLLDQLSKMIAVSSLGEVGNSTVVIPGVLDFTYTLNKGATGGILSENRWVFMVASTLVIIGVSVWVALGKVKSGFNTILLGLIVGGGIGNMIDRIANGKVVDFIDVTLVDFFPFNTVFNVADMFISLGCVALIISVIVGEIKEKKKQNNGKEQNKEPDNMESEKEAETAQNEPPAGEE